MTLFNRGMWFELEVDRFLCELSPGRFAFVIADDDWTDPDQQLQVCTNRVRAGGALGPGLAPDAGARSTRLCWDGAWQPASVLVDPGFCQRHWVRFLVEIG